MRHSKNNSSICDTTTLLSMSNVSNESSLWSLSNNRQQDLLMQKVKELELVLHTTLTEGLLLNKKQKELISAINQRKSTFDRMQRVQEEEVEDRSEDEMAETQRINYGWGERNGQINFARTAKHHQKFYSAIQSPSMKRSPQRNFEHFTLHSYQKSRYGLQTTTSSTKSGMIRKQRDQIKVRETPTYLSPTQRDFESIEDIWNEDNRTNNDNKLKRNKESKPLGHNSIKSFL